MSTVDSLPELLDLMVTFFWFGSFCWLGQTVVRLVLSNPLVRKRVLGWTKYQTEHLIFSKLQPWAKTRCQSTTLGFPAIGALSLPFFGWEVCPTQIDKNEQQQVPAYSNQALLELLFVGCTPRGGCFDEAEGIGYGQSLTATEMAARSRPVGGESQVGTSQPTRIDANTHLLKHDLEWPKKGGGPKKGGAP